MPVYLSRCEGESSTSLQGGLKMSGFDDDPADWEAESAIMGRIYEESLFTIAASSASDSSEGLFDVREKIDFVKIPYKGPEGLDDSPVYAYLKPPSLHIDRDTTPLNTRAWVIQEAVLSRRTVHFTKYGLIWSCSGFSQEEGIDDRIISRLDVTDWQQLIMRYSERDLTYKSDKLYAIQGLANKYAKRHGKVHYYGVFIEDLVASLRWFGNTATSAVPLTVIRGVGINFPSWSWASVTRKIEFLNLHVCQKEELVCGNLRALGSGLLGIEAPVKEIECFLGPFHWKLEPEYYIEELRMMDFGQEVPWHLLQWSPSKRYILQNASGVRIGWCRFDEDEAPMNKIFFMAIHKQNVKDWWMPPKETAEDKFMWGFVLSRRESTSAFERVGYGHIMDTCWIVNQSREDIVLM
ncbi:hypothetical protein N431DRAFT_446036 [Stipitochalara longipes BDJ]|nr:hypothetical protein N431DRAFT_446036 [Stipitochalara longipes BDJ]